MSETLTDGWDIMLTRFRKRSSNSHLQQKGVRDQISHELPFWVWLPITVFRFFPPQFLMTRDEANWDQRKYHLCHILRALLSHPRFAVRNGATLSVLCRFLPTQLPLTVDLNMRAFLSSCELCCLRTLLFVIPQVGPVRVIENRVFFECYMVGDSLFDFYQKVLDTPGFFPDCSAP